jgi:hypothetical protein
MEKQKNNGKALLTGNNHNVPIETELGETRMEVQSRGVHWWLKNIVYIIGVTIQIQKNSSSADWWCITSAGTPEEWCSDCPCQMLSSMLHMHNAEMKINKFRPYSSKSE